MRLALAVQTPEVSISLPVALLSGTWPEKVDKAAQLGVEGLELMTADPSQVDVHLLRSVMGARGITAVAVGTGAAVMQAGLCLLHADPELAVRARIRLNEFIAFAAAVGAPLVTIGSFRGRLARAATDGRAQLVEILNRAAEGAAASAWHSSPSTVTKRTSSTRPRRDWRLSMKSGTLRSDCCLTRTTSTLRKPPGRLPSAS
jgi:hypothetical protein